MKTIYNIIITSVLLLVCISCGDFLDLIPDNVATVESAFSNRASAKKFLYSCYSYRPLWGDYNRDPAFNGGDEAWASYVPNFQIFQTTRLQRGEQSVVNPILNYWDGAEGGAPLFIGIRDCNIFLENVDLVADLDKYERDRWVAEVKFLKAYYHYYLLKCYGPIPITDKNLPISASPEEVAVYRDKVDDVVDYVDNLIMEAVPDLPDCQDVIMSLEAGRVDKQIALAIRAEMLVMAASPLFNGNKDLSGLVDNRGTVLFNQNYDKEKWKRAIDACKEAIESCHKSGKKLYDEVEPITLSQAPVFQLQTMLRQIVCERWNCELIWGGTNTDNSERSRMATTRVLRLSSENMHSVNGGWAPTMKIIESFYTSNGVPMNEDKDWSQNGWYAKRYQIRPKPSSGDEKYLIKEGEQTCYMHYNREPRFYADFAFDKGIYYGNGKVNFDAGEPGSGGCNWTNWLAINGWAGFHGGCQYSITGYSAKKMASYKNGMTNYNTSAFEYYPFPVIRLGDLYLLYAEALNEYSGPSDEVYEYIDKIRKRAGLEGVIDSWKKYSTNPDKPKNQDGLRSIIHNERTIELVFEAKRYWDIRRWKEINTYNEQPRGWDVMGETNEDFYRVLNIAEKTVVMTLKDYFMPIRESNILNNKNLIQNYGW